MNAGLTLNQQAGHDLGGQRVVVIGGGSGLGLAIAELAVIRGGDVIVAGRNQAKLDAAVIAMGGASRTAVVDTTEKRAVNEMFEQLGPIDHLVLTASATKTGKVHELAIEDAHASMMSKFWGPYLCASAARWRDGGSLTLFSGVLSRKPMAAGAALASINAAVEALGRALALELAPVRVNTVSPGLIDTSAYDQMPADKRRSFFDATARSLPVGRVGTAEDIAAATLMLMTNAYVTGVTLDVDGGGLFVGTQAH